MGKNSVLERYSTYYSLSFCFKLHTVIAPKYTTVDFVFAYLCIICNIKDQIQYLMHCRQILLLNRIPIPEYTVLK